LIFSFSFHIIFSPNFLNGSALSWNIPKSTLHNEGREKGERVSEWVKEWVSKWEREISDSVKKREVFVENFLADICGPKITLQKRKKGTRRNKQAQALESSK
jgi:hypothetical protein